jgi:hypothetical protein
MEKIFLFVHSVMPMIYIAVGIAVFVKLIMISRHRGLDFVVIFVSFFKIYTISAQTTTSRKRKIYMLCNNIINLFIYASLLLFLLMYIIYRGNLFNYT